MYVDFSTIFFFKKINGIKLYCCCFCIIMLKSRKTIIEVSIDLSQCIYHFSSSSGFFFPSHLDKKAARPLEHFQQHKMQPPSSLSQSVAVEWHGAKPGREGKKRRKEKGPVADRQDFAFPHRSVYKLLFPALLVESLPATEGSSPFTAAITCLSQSLTPQDIHSQSFLHYLLHSITADHFIENCIREVFKVLKYLA